MRLNLVAARKDFFNWALSANRANAYRREMTAGSIDENKVLRVIGRSSRVLFDKNDPLSRDFAFSPVSEREAICVI